MIELARDLEHQIFFSESILLSEHICTTTGVPDIEQVEGSFVVRVGSVSTLEEFCASVRRQLGCFPWQGRRSAALFDVVDELLEEDTAHIPSLQGRSILILLFDDQTVLKLKIEPPDITLEVAMIYVVLHRADLYATRDHTSRGTLLLATA